MGLTDAKEIVKAVDERAKELKPLYDRFETDLKRVTSYEFKMPTKTTDAGATYDNYTTNKPKTLINKITGTLASAPLHIQLEYDKDTEAGREAKNNAERFIYGNIDLADTHFANMMLPTFQSQLAYYSSLFGWYAIRAWIGMDKENYGLPMLAVWYAGNVTWVLGKDGLAEVCHKRKVPIRQAIAEWGYKGGTKKGDITIYDWWDGETNSVIIDSKFVKKPADHKLGHPPVIIVVAGNAPPVQLMEKKDSIKYWGESALAPNRSGYDQFEHQMTYRQTMVAEGTHAPMGVWSPGGKKELKRSPWGKDRVVQFDSDTGEKAEPLSTPSTPQDAELLLMVIDHEITMGGSANILHGIDDPGGSGRRAQILGRHAAESLLSAPKEAIERGIEWTGREFLTQYSEGSFKGLKLRGEGWNNEKFNVDLKPEDVKGDWYPDVNVMAQLPEDEHTKILDAIALVEHRLSSRESVMDTRLGVRDTDLEKGKIDREDAMELLPIKLRRMIGELIDDDPIGNKGLIKVFMDEIERMERPQPVPSPASPAPPPEEAMPSGGGMI